MQSDITIQRAYYAATAHKYDAMHVSEDTEHELALDFMVGTLERLGVASLLDIGSGTGRVLMRMKDAAPTVSAVGVEPSPELRRIGHAKGIAAASLIDGDAMNLAFPDGSVDMVCAFGVLHHVPLPSRAVSEMLRVARKAIFISDANNFGQGRAAARIMKQTINALGLWPIANLIKTRGKGYHITDGDGLAYSYSLFSNYRQVAARCRAVHMLNTIDSGPNLYRTATHVALLGIKR